MSKPKKSTIEVQGADITVVSEEHGDYISLTDMAKKFGDDVADLQLDAKPQYPRIDRYLGANA